MKTVLDKTTRDEIVARISKLNENRTAEWGKMNTYQMLKHCVVSEEMYLGQTQYKRVFMGRLFGKRALNGFLKDEKPMERNLPTSDDFKVKETTGDCATEKAKWIALVEGYANYPHPYIVHWFFGKMTKEQIGYFAYKHADHHLRQFGC